MKETHLLMRRQRDGSSVVFVINRNTGLYGYRERGIIKIKDTRVRSRWKFDGHRIRLESESELSRAFHNSKNLFDDCCNNNRRRAGDNTE